MTYSYSALGQASPGGRISVGPVAQRDPLLAFTSVWSSNVLRMASQRPKGQRLSWVRNELNKMKAGLGDNFISEYRKLKRMGKPGDQALFDGLRLVLANRIATTLDRMAPKGASGLGSSEEDISAVFCGIIGVGTAGGAIAASFDNPSGSAAIGQAGSAALQGAGCNAAALAEQARIAEANAAVAQANAAAAAAQQTDDKTGLYLAIGGGAIALGLIGVVALRK